MKKYLLACLLPVAVACSSDDNDAPISIPEETPAETAPDSTSREWKPMFSRAASTSATLAGFTASGDRVFQTDMAYDGTDWQWADGSAPALGESETLICTLPAMNSVGRSVYYTPSQNSRLQWDSLHISSQADDGRFYFKNMTHRVAQMRIIVNRYFSVDDLKVHLAQSGYFNCLTGNFESLSSVSSRTVVPQSDGNGNYVYTFTIVPQTFKKGATLLTYKDVYSNGYYTYYHKLDRNITVDPNERLVVEAVWGEDWTEGGYTEIITYIDIDVAVADWIEKDINGGEAEE